MRRIFEFAKYVLTEKCTVTNDNIFPGGEVRAFVSVELPSSEEERKEALLGIFSRLEKYGVKIENNKETLLRRGSDVVYLSFGDYLYTTFMYDTSYSIPIMSGYRKGSGDYRRENVRIACDEEGICDFLSENGFQFKGTKESDEIKRKSILYGERK